MLGRPYFEELPPQIQKSLNRSVLDDEIVWGKAMEMHENVKENLPGMLGMELNNKYIKK